jgi:oxidase EvaA
LEIRAKSHLNTDLIPIKETEGWVVDRNRGDIHHRSGKFFSIKGIKVHSEQREAKDWCQPIIDQPEVGLLGFLVKKINGIYHFLVQAKEEPGNIGKVQLTSTLMATRSNLEQAHGGKGPLFLDYFRAPKDRRIIVNKLQSEEGARFYKKNNLNIVIELKDNEELDVPETFLWMSLYQIKELLTHENIVNACARSIIACLP